MRTIDRVCHALALDVTIGERIGFAFLVLGVVVSVLGLMAIGGGR